jgi:thiol-disulfide isomerase/thioredoxin
MTNQPKISLAFILPAVLFILFLAVIAAGCSSAKQTVSVKPNEHMEIGWTPRAVLQSPAYAWFDSGYAVYQPQAEYIDRLKRMKDSVEYLVIYATWCSDSKREMPRFFKIMDGIEFPQNRITMIAVDRARLLPAGISSKYGITNVPTFIVSYRGFELGRIIESPKTSLEQDFVDLLYPLFP